jgi:hypothetical protein
LIGESPIKVKGEGDGKYPTNKIGTSENALKQQFFNILDNINSGAAS